MNALLMGKIMQINNINSNQNFTAKLIDTYALRKFKAGLSEIQADTFEKIIKDIETVNDGKKFIYNPILIGNNKINRIHEVDANGKIINPPKFVDYEGKSLNIFEQMSSWYKNHSKII